MSNFIIQRMFSTSVPLKNLFNHVTVVGGGLMGSGIAQVTAQTGMDVTIVEINNEAIKKTNANIKSSLQRIAKKLFQNKPAEAEKYVSETMARLKISTNLKEAVESTDLVIEAIVENLDMKHKLFSKLDAIAPEHTIFTSNTSSLSITNIAAVTQRQDRFGGLHFFNPVPVMKLLEVIRTQDTSEETYQKLLSWGKAIGKTCITCKDTPGFVVNRLLIPYLAEAMRMLERGDASAKDIDIAMKLGAGHPMGPLELLDYVGLDTTKFILDGWHEKNPDHPLFKPIDLLEKMVSEGKIGKKSGEGFYSYSKIGNPNTSVRTSFSKPLVVPAVKTSSVASEKTKPEEFLDQMSKPSRKIKAERVQMVETSEEPQQNHSEGKMKKIARLRNLEQWKNSDEFIKSERDKPSVYLRKPPGRRLAKQIENYVSRDVFKSSEKFKNFQEFIRFEREKNFRAFDS